MFDGLEIQRSANTLIKEHGANASIQAAMIADAWLNAGDVEGQAPWRRILVAVNALVSTDRPADARVH